MLFKISEDTDSDYLEFQLVFVIMSFMIGRNLSFNNLSDSVNKS